MSIYLGLDTSNYTTSAAVLDTETGELRQEKKLLPVKQGEMGLRQSDAVFHHVRQLPEILEKVWERADGALNAVAASDRPQQVDGSYMPCFLVGSGAAREIAAAAGIPCRLFTHQQGHVAAALWGADRRELIGERFLAFHVSGGTTDALLVEPDEKCVIRCRVAAHSLDLKAGQLVDRVGGMMGLRFPAGPELDRLAGSAGGQYAPRPVLKGADCHLSGVENQCRRMLDKGAPTAETALFCLQSILAAVAGMTEALLKEYGPLPLVYAGGVMSNSLLRKELTARYGGAFAPPAFSGDNAAGVAFLCALADEAI